MIAQSACQLSSQASELPTAHQAKCRVCMRSLAGAFAVAARLSVLSQVGFWVYTLSAAGKLFPHCLAFALGFVREVLIGVRCEKNKIKRNIHTPARDGIGRKGS